MTAEQVGLKGDQTFMENRLFSFFGAFFIPCQILHLLALPVSPARSLHDFTGTLRAATTGQQPLLILLRGGVGPAC